LLLLGNYLSLSTGVWGDISKLFNELWFVEVERGIARKRLIARHLAAGLVDSPEAAAKRADENDLPNGDYIISNMMKPDQVIESIEDEEYAKAQEFR
jgi:pantothenate kinase